MMPLTVHHVCVKIMWLRASAIVTLESRKGSISRDSSKRRRVEYLVKESFDTLNELLLLQC